MEVWGTRVQARAGTPSSIKSQTTWADPRSPVYLTPSHDVRGSASAPHHAWPGPSPICPPWASPSSPASLSPSHTPCSSAQDLPWLAGSLSPTPSAGQRASAPLSGRLGPFRLRMPQASACVQPAAAGWVPRSPLLMLRTSMPLDPTRRPLTCIVQGLKKIGSSVGPLFSPVYIVQEHIVLGASVVGAQRVLRQGRREAALDTGYTSGPRAEGCKEGCPNHVLFTHFPNTYLFH